MCSSHLLRRLALLAALLALGPASRAAEPAEQVLVEIGQRIYREGLLPSGQPLQGLAAAQVRLSGARAACVGCHRRSGYGSSEGPVEVRSVTGPALFGPRVAPLLPQPSAAPEPAQAVPVSAAAEAARATANALRAGRAGQFAGTRQRPVYDALTLDRAIRQGVDVTGRPMSPSMPRFALDADALAALTAYLKTLSVQAAPGVSGDAVHFATVIQPGTDPLQRQALIDVLQAFIRDRNQGLRVEQRREAAGMVRLQRSWREWVLHVWDLHGDSDSWAAQLAAYNAQQPVFALLSGLGPASWGPIHAFSEAIGLPCIFPQTDVPVLAEHDFYTVYLSRGVTLEAQALARFLLAQPGRGPLMQVYGPDEASRTAAEAFRSAWQAGGGTALSAQQLGGPPPAAFWQSLAEQTPGMALVLWLAPDYLAQAGVLSGAGSQVGAVYLSSSLAADPGAGLAPDGRGRVRIVLAQDLPAARAARLEPVRRWLGSKGLALSFETLQMNAYLAATVTGLVMAHNMDTYSREYLLERMEHLLGNAQEASVYPRLSLGPGQRYASKGSYIVALAAAPQGQAGPSGPATALRLLSDWIVP